MKQRVHAVLLTDALRHHRDGRALLLADERGRTTAAVAEGTSTDRLIGWVASAAQHAGLTAAVDSSLHLLRYAAGALLLLALLAGIGASATALEATLATGVNVLWSIVLLVVVPLGFLALWLAIAFWSFTRGRRHQPSRAPGNLIGHAVSLLTGLLARATGIGDGTAEARRAAMTALISLLHGRRVGHWALGALTHMAWLAFALGALLACWVRLMAMQYDFVWGTTILSEDAAMALLLALTAWPAALGFPAPDAELLLATRAGGEAAGAGRAVWGGFLIGAIVAYVVIPRALLAVLCVALARRHAARLSPDLGHLLYQEGLIRLRRDPAASAPPGPRPTDVLQRSGAVETRHTFGSAAHFALIAVELDADNGWPPQTDWECIPLGHVTTRADARQVTADLAALTRPPRFVAVVASLARTPDRGAMDLLAGVAAAARAPVLLILTESEILQARGDDVAQRQRDWAERAERVGVNAVLTLDGDALSTLRQDDMERRLRQAGVS